MPACEDAFAFGRFRADRNTRTLTDNSVPVAISSRAFDVLLLLIEHRDRIVTKDEIMSAVWHGVTVDDNNLAVQISSLRRALGDHDHAGGHQLILTVSGRGYRFIGKLDPSVSPEPPPPPEAVPPRAPEAEPPRDPAPPAPSRSRTWRVTAGVLGLAIVGAVAAVLVFITRANLTRTAAPRLSIVVMPFRNLGDDPEDGYLADAVSDDLTTDLSHLPKSVVIARTSADSYKGRPVDAAQVGRELDVRYLLEGSLRRAGDRVTVNAQLIDTANGAHLWAERFDAPRQELAETQDAIVRHIASALNFTLVQIEGQRSLRDRPNDPDAVDLFFRARSLLDREDNLEAFGKAQPLLEKSLRLQPDFVEAATELAWLKLKKVFYFDDPNDAADMESARDLVRRALALAPQNARVLAARGFLLKLDGKCQEAIASDRLALSFDPNDIDALAGIAVCTANQGNPEEADRNLKELLRIDPQDPNNRLRYNQLGLVNLMLGRGEEAIAWFDKSMAGDSNAGESTDSLSRAEYNELGLIAADGLTGRVAEARTRYADYNRRLPRRTVWRIQSYFTKAEAALPGFRAAMASLKQAGMPEFADEAVDDHVAPSGKPRDAGDFEPTPTTIPGARPVTTAAMADLVGRQPAPLVVDVGRGAGVIPDARWIGGQAFPSPSGDADLRRVAEEAMGTAADRPIVVMGTGPTDWYGYNAALALVAAGCRRVLWYRGGEEAWAAAGRAAEDRRDP